MNETMTHITTATRSEKTSHNRS